MRLIHLTAVGNDVRPASIEFAARLTVIYGASETGKSYIIEAIDFMLGGKALRDVPEAAGYSRMMLGLELDDGRFATLVRPHAGGRIEIFDEDLRTLPNRPPDRTLAAQHSARNNQNLSWFLLGELNLAGAKVRKNQYNVLQNLSIRNLMHLCLVDETRMQSKASPIESNNPITRTAERSVFKLLLAGEDDSALNSGESPAEFRRVNKGKVDVLDSALAQLHDLLGDAADRPTLLEQLASLNQSINNTTESVEEALQLRDALLVRRGSAQEQVAAKQSRLADVRALTHRFELLDEQYSSDLERLGLVREAGTFLGYFEPGVCVFCGAEPEHQTSGHVIQETTELADSVDAEVAKTEALQNDLSVTIRALHQEELELRAENQQLNSDISVGLDSLRAAELQMLPQRAQLTELISRRSDVEQIIGIWDRAAEIEALRKAVAGEGFAVPEEVNNAVPIGAQRTYSETLRAVLEAWQVPGAETAHFSFEGTPDVIIDHRRRADRGKGMRSILHAGFSTALSEHCLQRDLPHPGFVVLDTPVLTYRDPVQGPDELDSADETLNISVSENFYAYLQTDHLGQVVVMENQNPPRIFGEDCRVEPFTGQVGLGRFGFYPK